MKKPSKKIAVIVISAILLAMNLLNPIVYAASDVYELAFDNLFVFEQWANHAKSGIVGPGLTGGEITKDISAGSFTLINNSTTGEIYTAHSMGSNTGYYSMPVEPDTTYIFEYNANGTVTNFESFVFYFDSLDTYISHESAFATQYGHNMWSFTTPSNAAFIQIRFDNNSTGSYATVSDIRICKSEVYEYSQNNVFRKTYTYSASGGTYGELPQPEREGLVFAGWYTGPDGTGDRITADTAINATSYSLYSKWDPVVLGDLAIATLPSKLDYCVGEKLNTSGLTISITYPDGTTEILESGFYCSPQVLEVTGTQTITVTYGNKSAEFTVNVKEAEDVPVTFNGSAITVPVANYKYTFGKTVSAFNRYEIHYSSDAYVKGIMLMGETEEEFFLEPSDDGVFEGYIDGFLDGTTRTQITSISFTALDVEFMDFSLESVTTTNNTVPDNMVYLSSTDYKIGIDLHWGGALTYLEDLTNNVMSSVSKYGTSKITEVDFKSKVGTSSWRYNTSSNVNLINCNDTGRLVQQSYYGTGSYPYEPGDYNGTPWNYNPVQGGNVHNEASKIVDLKVTDNEIYVKCRPLDWGKTAEHITPSYMEAWYTLEDGLMRATCRFVDYSGYPSATTTQELPAFYCVEPLNTFVYYSGGEPWSDSNTKTTESSLVFWGDTEGADQNFYCNENWAAYIGDDADSFGIGLYCPGQTNMFTGVFNRDLSTTVSPATESPTSYIAAVDTFTFKSYSPYSYAYYITTGNVDTIRSNFKAVATNPADPCNVGYTNGFCNNCGKYEVPTLTTDKYDLNSDGTKENVYEISNAGELYWFSANVNAGDNSANAVLLCDITDNNAVLPSYGVLNANASDFRVWEPIGNATYQYKGMFDGQGYTVNGLYINDSTKSYAGLFGYVGSGATIKKTGIDNSYFSGNQYIGGLCGQNAGTIENCYTYCTVSSGNSYIGGAVGYTSGNIKNCYNAGVANAVNNYCGGFAGGASSATKLSYCYYLSDCAKDGTGTSQNGIGNSAKGSITADGTSTSICKTMEEFASGEVAYLLQSSMSEQLWGQKTNVQGSCPIFETSGEYKVIASQNTSYSLVDIGDIVEDEIIDAKDYQQLVNIVLSKDTFDDSDYFNSDIDGDGALDVIDCSLLEKLVNGHQINTDVYLKGDFDFDSVAFTAADITAIKKAINNTSGLSTIQKYVCDLNGDEVIDDNDMALLNQQEVTVTAPIYLSMKETMSLKSKTANVIILCGQSNTYGASPLTDEVKAAVGDTDFSNIKIKYNNINSDDGLSNWRTHYSNDSFETFRLGIGGQADRWFGPEVGLAYCLATNEATKNEEWYIIKYAAAGTYLGGNWLYESNYNNASNAENIYNDLGGYLADNMLSYVDSALNEIAIMHGADKINIRSFMWHQGESDSCVEAWANQYGDLQNILVNKVRTAFESRDADAHIGFVDGGIAAYNSNTFYNPLLNADQTYNGWVYSDTVNTHKTNNASLWYVPEATTKNIIGITSVGLYQNSTSSTTKLADSIWIDTSTCKSKYENNNENSEFDGAHYCGDSMFKMGQWYAYGMLQVSAF